MNTLLRNVLIGVAALVIVALLFLGYMGMFKTVKVMAKTAGPYTAVCEAYVGPYDQTGKVFDRVGKMLQIAGVTTQRAIGVYYDNPQVVAKAKLRSDCGFLVDDKNLKLVKKLKNKEFKIITFKKSESLIAAFPIRNSLSYMIGPMKAYPALMKYAQAKGYTINGAFEIYDTKAVYYVMPITKK